MSTPVRKARIRLGNIPLILAKPEQPRGIVLVYHGAGGSKERTVRIFAPLAAAGFLTLHPDAPGHGERTSGQAPDAADPVGFEVLFQSTLQSAAEAEGILNAPEFSAYRELPRFAVGISMGGFIVHLLASHDAPRFKAAVCLTSSGFPLSPPTGFVAKDPNIARMLAEPPPSRAEAYPPTALLHLHGSADQIVPVDSMLRTLEHLRPAYRAHPGMLAHTVLEGVKHEVTPVMIRLTLAWLEDGV